jgi:hypothetical protein
MGNEYPFIPLLVLPNTDPTDYSSTSLVLTLLIIVKLAQLLLTHGSTFSVLTLLTHYPNPKLSAHDVRTSYSSCANPFFHLLLALISCCGSLM